MAPDESLARITAQPDTFDSMRIVRKVRISAEPVFSLLVQVDKLEASLEGYPELEPDDIRACAVYLHTVVANDMLSAVAVAES